MVFTLVSGLRDCGTAFGGLAQVLCRAVISVQSREAQDAKARYCLRERKHWRAGLTPQRLAPTLTSTYTSTTAPAAGGCASEVFEVVQIVDTNADGCLVGQCCKTGQFPSAYNFVRDEHVADTTVDHRFGFAHFLAAHSHCAQRDLAQRDLGAFVGLRMRPDSNASAAQGVVEMLEIVLEHIEIQKKSWGVDFIDTHPE